MVWKIACICCMLAIFNSVEVQAATYTAYDGNISTTYLDMFDSMSISLGDDYVVFRSSQYNYHLFYGELVFDNGVFSGSGKLVTISQSNNNYSNNYYSIITSEDNNFNLNAGNKVVYSSLGQYPSMYEEDYYFNFLILLLLAVILVINIIKPVFSFVLRNRNGVIS